MAASVVAVATGGRSDEGSRREAALAGRPLATRASGAPGCRIARLWSLFDARLRRAALWRRRRPWHYTTSPLPRHDASGVGRLDLAQPRRDPSRPGRRVWRGSHGERRVATLHSRRLTSLAAEQFHSQQSSHRYITPTRIKNVANVCTTSLERASVRKRISATVGPGGGGRDDLATRSTGWRWATRQPSSNLGSHLANSSIFATHARAAAAGEGRRAGDGCHAERRLSRHAPRVWRPTRPTPEPPGLAREEGPATHARAAVRGEGRRGRRPTPEPPLGAREVPAGDGRQSRRSGRGDGRRRQAPEGAARLGGWWWRRAPEAAAAVEGVAGVPGKEGGATTATRGEGRRAGGDRWRQAAERGKSYGVRGQ